MLPGGQKIPNITKRISPVLAYSSTNSSGTTFMFMPMVLCNDTRLFKENLFNVSDLIIIGDRDDYFCPPDDFKMPLQGKFGNSAFTMIEFVFL